MMSFRNKENGFTLVELMIVIAIIGILAAIAIPQYSIYRQKTYNEAARVDAKSFYSTALADATGPDDKTFSEGALPPGHKKTLGVSFTGSFVYTATDGTITCDTVFSHAQGTKTYAVDPDGTITEADK